MWAAAVAIVPIPHFFYHGDILYLSKYGYIGGAVLMHGYNNSDHYPALSLSRVKSHACKSKASTTSGTSCGFGSHEDRRG